MASKIENMVDALDNVERVVRDFGDYDEGSIEQAIAIMSAGRQFAALVEAAAASLANYAGPINDADNGN